MRSVSAPELAAARPPPSVAAAARLVLPLLHLSPPHQPPRAATAQRHHGLTRGSRGEGVGFWDEASRRCYPSQACSPRRSRGARRGPAAITRHGDG
jgi:hypothetical protein